MNSAELNALVDEIHCNCEDVRLVAKSVVVNKNRAIQLGEYASRISTGISDLVAREKLRKDPRISDSLLLLSICLEDVKSFLEKFAVLNKDLALSIIKCGSHCLEFVKLTEQLQHCSVLIRLNIAVPEDDGFDEDVNDLALNLPDILLLLFKESDKENLKSFIQKTEVLIGSQETARNSYKSKRTGNEDVTMKSNDLVLVKTIGRGGFSTVWLGKFRGENVAVKVMSVEATSITLEEFQQEADLMRRLSNKNIVAYYGITEIDNGKVSGHCMIMEYLVNDSLFNYIKNNKSENLDWAKKVDIALDIASGIAFLHRLRIIHRDIKLGNILLDEHLHAKVADFGLSFTKTSNNSVYTMNEGGTIPYMVNGNSLILGTRMFWRVCFIFNKK
jgi:hypothetical protein